MATLHWTLKIVMYFIILNLIGILAGEIGVFERDLFSPNEYTFWGIVSTVTKSMIFLFVMFQFAKMVDFENKDMD